MTGLALATAVGQWINLSLLYGLALRRGWTAPGRTLGVTVLGVTIACGVLALLAVYGLPFAERLVPPLPHLREIVVLSVLGLAGAAAYGGTRIAVLAALGVRLRRA